MSGHLIRTVKLALEYLDNPLLTLLKYQLGFRTKIKLKSSDVYFYEKRGRGTLSNLLRALERGVRVNWADRTKKEYLFEYNSIKLIQPNIGVLGEKLEEVWINPVKPFLDSHATVLDVGAYFGETSVLFAKHGARKVLAVEPIPKHIKYLKTNIIINKMEGRITVLPYAVGERDGSVVLTSSTPPGSGSFGLEAGKYKVRVKSISWAHLLKIAINENVAIVKSDCEGCERFIPQAGRIVRKIPLWLVEIHSKPTKCRLLNFFKSLGFNTECVKEISPTTFIYKMQY